MPNPFTNLDLIQYNSSLNGYDSKRATLAELKEFIGAATSLGNVDVSDITGLGELALLSTINSIKIEDSSLIGRSILSASTIDVVKALLAINISDVSGMGVLAAMNSLSSANLSDGSVIGREIFNILSYSNLKSQLNIASGDVSGLGGLALLSAITASQISDASTIGTSILKANTITEVKTLLEVFQPNIIIKPSDESRSNAAVTSDAHLLFPVEINSYYEFDMELEVTCTTGTGGLRGNLLLPSGAYANYGTRNSGNSTVNNGIGSTIISSIIAAASSVATQLISVKGNIKTTNTSGNVAWQWGQNAASPNPTTIKVGSKLLWRKL
jgi:hypothetical protein